MKKKEMKLNLDSQVSRFEDLNARNFYNIIQYCTLGQGQLFGWSAKFCLSQPTLDKHYVTYQHHNNFLIRQIFRQNISVDY